MINVERFKNLIRATAEADPKHFNMAFFGQCGTPACVLGNYAAREDLQDAFCFEDNTVKLCGSGVRISYANIAVRDHFGITAEETQRLFASWGCSLAETPAEAVGYLQRFLSRKQQRI